MDMVNRCSLLDKLKTRTAQNESKIHIAKLCCLPAFYTANVQVFESLQIVATYNNTKQLIQCYNLYILLHFETTRSLYLVQHCLQNKNPFSEPDVASEELINVTPTTSNHQFGLKLAN